MLADQRRPQRAASAVRVAEDGNRAANIGRNRLGDRRDILEFAFDRVRRRVP
jgi:hypothetical protein